MLDSKCEFIINYLIKTAKETCDFVVLEVEEFLSNAPKFLSLDKDGLLDSLKSLSALGYVNLRYVDDLSLCLSATKKALSYQDNKDAERAMISMRNAEYFKWSFLGSFCGGIVVVLIFLICSILW